MKVSTFAEWGAAAETELFHGGFSACWRQQQLVGVSMEQARNTPFLDGGGGKTATLDKARLCLYKRLLKNSSERWNKIAAIIKPVWAVPELERPNFCLPRIPSVPAIPGPEAGRVVMRAASSRQGRADMCGFIKANSGGFTHVWCSA